MGSSLADGTIGAYVAGIGDVNDDGFADVRIASIGVSSNGLTENGQAYIVYGKPSPASHQVLRGQRRLAGSDLRVLCQRRVERVV